MRPKVPVATVVLDVASLLSQTLDLMVWSLLLGFGVILITQQTLENFAVKALLYI